LPLAHRSALVDGLAFEELLKHPVWGKLLEGYPFQAGQPEEVRKWYEQAMGVLWLLPDSPKSN